MIWTRLRQRLGRSSSPSRRARLDHPRLVPDARSVDGGASAAATIRVYYAPTRERWAVDRRWAAVVLADAPTSRVRRCRHRRKLMHGSVLLSSRCFATRQAVDLPGRLPAHRLGYAVVVVAAARAHRLRQSLELRPAAIGRVSTACTSGTAGVRRETQRRIGVYGASLIFGRIAPSGV